MIGFSSSEIHMHAHSRSFPVQKKSVLPFQTPNCCTAAWAVVSCRTTDKLKREHILEQQCASLMHCFCFCRCANQGLIVDKFAKEQTETVRLRLSDFQAPRNVAASAGDAKVEQPAAPTAPDRLFEELFESVYDAVFITRTKGRLLKQNSRARQLLDYDDTRLNALSILQIVVGATEQHLQLILRQLEKEGRIFIEANCLCSDGRQFPAELTVNQIHYTDEGQLCFFIRDISARLDTEKELESERFYMQQLMHNSTDMIYFKDQQSRFLRVSAKMAERFGAADVEQMVGKTDIEFFSPVHAGEARQDELQIMASGQPIVNKLEREQWHDGHTTWVSTTKMPLYDTSGAVTGTFGISRDITRQKQIESELKAAQAELVKAAHSAGMAEIATGILHDVGNVLNSVTVSAELVRELADSPTLKNLGKANELIRSQLNDLANFLAHNPRGQKLPLLYLHGCDSLCHEHTKLEAEVSNLLKYIEVIRNVIQAQQSYARSGLHMEEVILSELIDDALSMQAMALESAGVEVVRHQVAVPTLMLQKSKVIHVVVNLLSNARDALRKLPAMSRRIDISLWQADANSVCLAVADNGEGVAPENLGKLFTHGFTTKDDGHGFGLHTSANFMHEIGGRIELTSPGPDQGACCTLTFPIVTPEAVVAAVPSPRSPKL